MSRATLRSSSARWSDFGETEPYPVGSRPSLLSLSAKYSLPPDPQEWGFDVSPLSREADDYLHDPASSSSKSSFSHRAFSNVGCLAVLCFGIIALFMGYPIARHFTQRLLTNGGGFNLGGINATGQIPFLTGGWGLIDLETPKEAYTKPSWEDGSEMRLVFSDEFNTDGRSFYPGDDPYWEAADLHYWGTNNLEWYDPEAVTTSGGNLVITLSRKQTHDLNFQGGLITSWNKFCFTGGYIETSVQLPGFNNVLGLWPAVWTMGNLGRAGYGASLDGMWPYTYDSCDVGTVANQTLRGLPQAATVNGDAGKGGALSWLPGQRLSRCTCRGEDHPGPIHSDGTFVGRSAPEIDIFEAQINEHTLIAGVSQSAQWAPFNEAYRWLNTSQNMIITNPAASQLNTFMGSITQQATSVVTNTNPLCYEKSGGCFATYGFEYKPGFDNSYITWISENKIDWTIRGSGVGPDPNVQIGTRPVPQEPMYIIANLGMSRNFGPVDLDNLPFPSHMLVDYIRVYQPANAINIGCNPKDFPTETYINKHLEAYMNPNRTTWVDDYKQPWPKNSFLGEC